MTRRMFSLMIVGAVVTLVGCAKSNSPSSTGGFGTVASLPTTSATTPAAPSNIITASLGETDPMHMFIKLSGTTATAGKVTFVVTNDGTKTHEFVVLQSETPAANFPIGSFEGESNRIDEDAAGTNVGETGDMKPGETKALVIDMTAGHYALVCNLVGHYAMGMHQDFTVQ
jgi:uncharacterized cupredoxin-like copper-binding protein